MWLYICVLCFKPLIFNDFNVTVMLALDAKATQRIQRNILTTRVVSCVTWKVKSSLPGFRTSNKQTG
jgi:hypothetical protein